MNTCGISTALSSPEIQNKIASLRYYGKVPKDIKRNLEFRRNLIREGAASKESALQIWRACAQDPLFYINAMCWILEPRTAQALPFITWTYQDEVLMEIDAAIGSHDVLIEKSRDMGASWMALTIFQWRWQFKELQNFMLISRKQEMVDKADEPDALFYKLDFLIKHQPKWMLRDFDADRDRKSMMLVNRSNGSTISGDSTTGDSLRGGRKAALLLDEFASVPEGDAVLSSTRDAAPCRILNSTPKGTANAFYKMRQKMIAGEKKVISLHWELHPQKSKDKYRDAAGKLRSPWYDEQCARAAHPMEIAQELDIDYVGSSSPFFDGANLRKIESEIVKDPFLVGDLDYDPLSLEVRGFIPRANGPLRLWMNLDDKGRPAPGDYVLGADVATGTGASNSTITGGLQHTKEKVLEFALSTIRPEDMARYAVALAQWLKNGEGRGAKLIWEANGPGRNFGDQVIDSGYRFIYYRTDEGKITKRVTDTPGWFSTPVTKLSLLGEYRRALHDLAFINRSKEAIEECYCYIFNTIGNVEHSGRSSADDPSGAKDNHGDRVIADALCWHLMKDAKTDPDKPPEIPANCIQARRDARRQAAREESFY